MIRFANLVGQAGIYKTGTPNYIDVADTYLVGTDMVLFATKETDDSWADGDTMGVRIYSGLEKYKVWYAAWRSATQRLELVTEEETAGSWTDGDEVAVSGCVTAGMMDHAIWEPQFTLVTGTTYTVLATDVGKTICYTSGSAVAVTLDADLPVGFHCIHVQEGVGTVTVDTESTDTINGIGTGTGFAVTGQFQSLYTYQRTAGAWMAIGA